MRLLADENIHKKVFLHLQGLGQDIEWLRHTSPGASDEDILARSDIAECVFLTCDRDFGELILKRNLPRPFCILYSRIEHRDWMTTTERLLAVLEAGVMAGAITTITKTRIRVRHYPTGNINDEHRL